MKTEESPTNRLERGSDCRTGLHVDLLGDLIAEVVRARDKFPHGDDLGLALLEEVQELFDELSLVEGATSLRVREEAIQVACVALRIAEEGDPTWYGDRQTSEIMEHAKAVGLLAREHLDRKYPKGGAKSRAVTLNRDTPPTQTRQKARA